MKIRGKDDIRLQALEILSFEGTEALSMSELAKRVGLSKATLYHYYESKEQILDDVFDSGHRHLMQHGFHLRLTGNAKDDLSALAENWLSLFRDDENYMYIRVLTSLHLTDDRAKDEYRALILMLRSQSEVVIQKAAEKGSELLSSLFSSMLFSKLEEILEEDSDDDGILSEIEGFAELIRSGAISER